MLLAMQRDNLTDALAAWSDSGVSQSDMALPTIYKDIVTGALSSNALLTTATEMIQMIQGRLTWTTVIFCF